MINRILLAIRWRYINYLSEYVDLYGGLFFYLKQRFSLIINLKNSNVIYIYANKRNVGDYISFLGIKYLLDSNGVELFCSPVWNSKLKHILTEKKMHGDNCLLIIGGGGLLQPVFKDFWEIILESEIPFATVGIGINKMIGSRGELEDDFLALISNRCEWIGVRDEYTKHKIETCNRKNIKVNLGVCPSVNFVYKNYWINQFNKNGYLLHVFHDSDLRLAQIDVKLISNNLKKAAKLLGLKYKEHNNISSNYNKALQNISSARIVVSSRLHGCIIPYAMGVPFVPIICDFKTEAFLETHTHKQGYKPSDFCDQFNCISILKQELADEPVSKEAIVKEVNNNQMLFREINNLIP